MEKTLVNTLKIGLLFTVFLSPLVYWSSLMFPYLTLKVFLFQSLVEILTAVWLTLIIFYPSPFLDLLRNIFNRERVRDKKYRPRFTPLLGSLLLLLTVMLISAWFGVDFIRSFWSNQSRQSGIFFLIHLILFFLMLSVISERWWRWFWWSGMAVSAVGVIGGVAKEIIFPFYNEWDGFSRIEYLFGNPTFLAGYLLFNVFAGLYLFLTEKNKWLKTLALCFSLIAGTGVLFTETIGDLAGLFSGLILLAFYFIYHLHNKFNVKFWRNVIITFLLLGVLTGLLFFITKNYHFWHYIPGFSRLAEIHWGSTNVQNRLIAWKAGWQIFKEKPLLGWGWENFNIGFNKFYNPTLLTSNFSETYWDKPHNLLLEYLYTTGILGLLSFLGVLGAAFYEIWKAHTKENLLIIFAFALIAYLVQGLVVFDTFGVYLMLFLVLAFIDIKYKEKFLYSKS